MDVGSLGGEAGDVLGAGRLGADQPDAGGAQDGDLVARQGRDGEAGRNRHRGVRVGDQWWTDSSMPSRSARPARRARRATLLLPTKETWQETTVEVGDAVTKKQLLAKGVTRIYFQANVWVFAVLVILIGSIWGIGKAAVYRYIPDYFPEEVGVVGGMVGVLGGSAGSSARSSSAISSRGPDCGRAAGCSCSCCRWPA